MRAVVVYESMYGNTHLIADAIGEGLRGSFDEVEIVPVERAGAAMADGVDLLVVGGPTHAHGMTHESTRQAAVSDAHTKPEKHLDLDADAEGPGLRDWFDALAPAERAVAAAAFDTRFHMNAALTGRASKGIAKRLRRHHYALTAEPESFFVTKENHLEPEEDTRARAWGDQLARAGRAGSVRRTPCC